MKASSFILLAALCVPAVADDDTIPTSWPKERYASMVEKSPFVLETKIEAPKEEKPSPFDNTYIKGVGTGYVVVQRMGDNSTMRFWDNAPNPEGIYVKQVIHGDRPAATKVVLKKGEEEKEIGFNENELRGPVSAPPAPNGRTNGQLPPPGKAPGMVPAIPRPPTIQTNNKVPLPPATMQTQYKQPQAQGQPGGRNTTNFQNGGNRNFAPGGSSNNAVNSTGTNPGNDANGGRQRIRVIRQ